MVIESTRIGKDVNKNYMTINLYHLSTLHIFIFIMLLFSLLQSKSKILWLLAKDFLRMQFARANSSAVGFLTPGVPNTFQSTKSPSPATDATVQPLGL